MQIILWTCKNLDNPAQFPTQIEVLIFPYNLSPKSHNAMFFFRAQIFNSITESLILKNWSSLDFGRSYESINVFVFSSFYCNMICFTPFRPLAVKSHRSLQRAFQNITAKSYPVFETAKIEIISKECVQEISSCFICFTQQMKVIINCGKSVKSKQVISLGKRISNKFFQCLQVFTTSIHTQFGGPIRGFREMGYSRKKLPG